MSADFEPGGFANVDAAGSPAAYSANLDRARSVAAIVENRLLVRDALVLAPGDAVLDVGSGNGEEVCEIAAIVGDRGRVVGVDLSTALVEEARRRAPTTLANIEFVVGDGHDLPFEDGEFDSVRTERTLQHVDNPARIASEMVRIVRSGGRVAVWEPDWGLLFIGSTDQEASTIVANRVAAAVRNPRIGRNLASLFRRAGLRDLSVVARIGLWETLAAAEERARLTSSASSASQRSARSNANCPAATASCTVRRTITLLDHELEQKTVELAPALLALPGCGTITAAKLLAEIGPIGRFENDAQLARHSGVAPLQASSGRVQRHRLDRGGNRQLNCALYRIAITQARVHPPARAYLERKQAEGKSRREAIRCLKRTLARIIFNTLKTEPLLT